MLSERAHVAAAMFGVDAEEGCAATGCAARADELAGRLDAGVGAGRVGVVAGPSGSGKTSVLRALSARLGRRGVRVPAALPARAGRRVVVDLFRSDLLHALRLLAKVGLADAHLLTRRAGTLSDGQRWRLLLALGMERAERRRGASVCRGGAVTLVVDEFCSSLDEVTGVGVAVTLSRWAQREGDVRAVVASWREDVVGALRPAVVLRCGLDGGVAC